jgi:NADPH-dependent curcumin reductase CurA
MISQYNETGETKGPSNIILAVGKSLRMEGFIVSNHYDLYPQFAKDMGAWIKAGQDHLERDRREGVERAPDAFIKLFSGENMGKMLVKLG